MPTVKITSTAGPAKIAYSISTPSKVEAKEIDKKLPCLVLLVRFLSIPSSSPGELRTAALMDSDLGWVDLQHPVFCASEIWHRPSFLPSIQPSLYDKLTTLTLGRRCVLSSGLNSPGGGYSDQAIQRDCDGRSHARPDDRAGQGKL